MVIYITIILCGFVLSYTVIEKIFQTVEQKQKHNCVYAVYNLIDKTKNEITVYDSWKCESSLSADKRIYFKFLHEVPSVPQVDVEKLIKEIDKKVK